VEKVKIMFQGGFVGLECSFNGGVEGSETERLGEFYPENVSSEQIFAVGTAKPVDKFQLLFNKSADFYGRITIYKIDVVGSKMTK